MVFVNFEYGNLSLSLGNMAKLRGLEKKNKNGSERLDVGLAHNHKRTL